MKHALFITMVFLSVLSQGQETAPSKEVKITPKPDWVMPLKWDRSQTERDRQYIDGDTHYLLFDQQVNATTDQRQSYRQVVYRFLTETGVQDNAQVEISFDPEYERVELHSLVVHRNGEASDRLPDQKIKIIQREEDLNRHLYDGRLSAVLLLEDIRVGDVLEYSYTRRGANPIYDGHFMRSFSTQWSIPINRTAFRLLWPAEKELFIKSHISESEPEITKKGQVTEYLWDIPESEPIIPDDALPSWYTPWGWVQFTDFKNWREVTEWALGIYKIEGELPTELNEVIEEARQLEGIDQQAGKIVRFVQDEFRYLGVESGINSHKPYPIETIASRRFGDCKDKSNLLCAMLRELGVEAYPALVDTSEKRTIADYLPSVHAFNHVIVQIRLDDRTVWIDPTIRLQGGSLGNTYFPNYGKALVIAPDTTDLTEIDRDRQDSSSIKVTESFDFQDYDGPGLLRVKTIFRGYEADRMRRRLAESSIAEMERDYAEFYAYTYDDVDPIDPPEFNDDRAANAITCFESYHLSEFWEVDEEDEEAEEESEDVEKSLPRIWGAFDARNFKGYLDKPGTRNRSMPFALSHPRKVTHEIVADFPWPLKFDEEDDSVDSHSFSAAFKRSTSVGGLKMSYTYQSKEDHVAPEKFSQYLDDVERIEDGSYYSFSVPGEWASGSVPIEELSEEEEEVAELSWLNENRAMVAWIGGASVFVVILILVGGTVLLILVVDRKSNKAVTTSPPPLPGESKSDSPE